MEKHPTHQQTLQTYCRVCGNVFDVPKEKIYDGEEFAKYATRCPICGFEKLLFYEEVEKVYGELNV